MTETYMKMIMKYVKFGGRKIVTHVCSIFWQFLSLPSTSINVKFSKKINQSGEHDLEVSERYWFQGPAKAIAWMKGIIIIEEKGKCFTCDTYVMVLDWI